MIRKQFPPVIFGLRKTSGYDEDVNIKQQTKTYMGFFGYGESISEIKIILIRLFGIIITIFKL